MDLSFWAVVLVSLGLGVVMLGFITLNRYIAYKERVALAQLGFSLDALNRGSLARTRGNRGVLWGGVITATSGLGLLLGLATLGGGVWLLAGFLPLSVGLGMVLIYFLTMGTASVAEDERPARDRLLAVGEEGEEPPEPEGGQDSSGC